MTVKTMKKQMRNQLKIQMKRCMQGMLAGLMAACLLSGCGRGTTSGTEHPSASGGEVVSDGTQTQDTKEMQLFQNLFDLNQKVKIEIAISDEELQKLQEDFEKYDRMGQKSPIYRKADQVTITIGEEQYTVPEVGIRIKGNTSRESVWNDKTGLRNLTHYRLSFNETFDNEQYYGNDKKEWESEEARKERKNRRFATLKSLEMKWNRNYDQTYVREYYTYRMFRENGVLSPNTSLSQVVFRGKNAGVFSIYEPVDQEFLYKNYEGEDAEGDLYKCGWTFKPADYTNSVTYGVEDENYGQNFNFNLKTNKKTSKHEDLKELIRILNTTRADEAEAELSKVMDTKNFAKFLALSYFAGGPDDIRNNYNNHYVYFIPSTGMAMWIPYDYDRCMGITYGWNPDGTGMTMVSPFSERAEGAGRGQQSPLIKKTIFQDAFLNGQYKEELQRLADSEWMTLENFTKYYEIAKKNYEDVCEPEESFANAENENFKFTLEGADLPGDKENMSIQSYFEKMMETYRKAVEENR